jgi:hypothetical protein
MAFDPWNEGDPASGDPAGTLWDDIQKFKVQVRERLAGVFSDWSTATDRLTAIKLCVNAVSGFTVRDATDANDYFIINKDGFPVFKKPVIVHLHRLGAATDAFAANPVLFPGNPTETLDFAAMHTANWRVTIPAGMTGIYKVKATVNISGGAIDSWGIQIRKNGASVGPIGYSYLNAATFEYTTCIVDTVLALTAADYIEPFIVSGGGTGSVGDMQFYVERIN